MGLFDWLKSLFSPKPTARDISGLALEDPDAVSETIDTSGGPLKEYHLRRALRDPRLLPKPKSIARNWLPTKKPKLFASVDAKRLFSHTMRTRNRAQRDLSPDLEQLERYGLPRWQSEEEIAQALNLSLSELQHFSIHRHRETTPHYVTFAIRKRTGGHRLIHAPKKRLKAIQRQLNTLLVSKLPTSDFAHGFRSGHSVKTNAAPHVGKRFVIKLDIQDCFPSIHFGRIRGLFIALGYGYPVANCLAVLMTEAPRQPVNAEGKIYHVPVGPRVCVAGAPTSPGLCNAVLMRLDHRLAGLGRKYGFAYSRYADDLPFSGDDPTHLKALLSLACRVLREEGFRANSDKTRVMRAGRRQTLTGVTVNREDGLSRVERRRLRAAIHQFDPADQKSRQRLAGKLAYLHMLNPTQAAPLRAAFEARIQ